MSAAEIKCALCGDERCANCYVAFEQGVSEGAWLATGRINRFLKELVSSLHANMGINEPTMQEITNCFDGFCDELDELLDDAGDE